MTYHFEPIGLIESCFKEKFGTPRQPGLAPAARAILRLNPSREMQEAVRDLEGFTHIWVIFVFHQAQEKWNPLVRPPRLGGARKIGVLASRAPLRPNPIGISAVRLEKIEGTDLHVSGGDFLDGSPILDVKPYLAYADSHPDASPGWTVRESFDEVEVSFSPAASQSCSSAEREGYANLRPLIEQLIRLDPRPAFERGLAGEFASRVEEFDVHWTVDGEKAVVTEIRKI